MQINHEFLKVEGLSKTYVPGASPVFENVNFDITQGEFVVSLVTRVAAKQLS